MSDDIVRLATASNPAEAAMWQNVLEEEGIAAKVVGEALTSGIGDVEGLRPEVWVHRADLERAAAALEAHRQAAAEDAEPDEG